MKNSKFQPSLDLTEEWNNLPFAHDWQNTFHFIEAITQKNNEVMSTISNVLNTLIYDGNTYESLVLDTAQTYLFAKLTKSELEPFETVCSKFVLDGSKFLLKNSEDLDKLYDSNDFPYIYKIKLAELIYLLENSKLDKKTLSMVDKVILDHEADSQKGLMNHLIAARNKIGE